MGAKEEKSLLELLLKDSHIVQCGHTEVYNERYQERYKNIHQCGHTLMWDNLDACRIQEHQVHSVCTVH